MQRRIKTQKITIKIINHHHQHNPANPAHSSSPPDEDPAPKSLVGGVGHNVVLAVGCVGFAVVGFPAGSVPGDPPPTTGASDG